jgi:hypothetical protein
MNRIKNDRLQLQAVKDRRKEALKLLAALRLGDDYAKRKIVRRLVPALALVLALSSAPAFAKQVTDEELNAFLSGKPVPAPVAAMSALTSKEGETKNKPVNAPKAAAVKAEPEAPPHLGRVVVDPKTKKRSYELPSAPKFPKDAKTVETKLKGTVGIKILNGMSLTFETDAKTGSSKELWVDFHDGIKLSGAKSVQDFGEGDEVEAVVVETEDHSKRLVTALTMLHHIGDAERKRMAEAERMAEESGVQATEDAR